MRITKDWLPLYGVWELLLFKRGNLPSANLTLLKINNLGVIFVVKIQTVLFFLEYLSSLTLCHPHLQVAILYIFPECLLNKSFVSSRDVKLLYFKEMKWNVTNWFCNAFYCDDDVRSMFCSCIIIPGCQTQTFCLWLLAPLIRARCSVVLIWRCTDCNIWQWETRILILCGRQGGDDVKYRFFSVCVSCPFCCHFTFTFTGCLVGFMHEN